MKSMVSTKRHTTRCIKIGRVYIGGNKPVAIQSMAKTKTSDVLRTTTQIQALQDAGCQIVRVAVRDLRDAQAIRQIKKGIRIPLVADIHFDYRLALLAIDSGADKIRLNPGNIYKDNEVKEVVAALKQARLPLRVGVNSGSVADRNSKRMGMPARLVASALAYVRKIEKMKFYDMVVSLKASTVRDTIEAYRAIAGSCDYPLHLGLTATGTPRQGVIKSAIACGVLLAEGIGDTIRVSLTDDPREEVRAAQAILEALGLGSFGPRIISCPTCGRCEVDLVRIVAELDKKLRSEGNRGWRNKSPKVAVMGCVVNGPGEAKEAEIGVAFGKHEGLLFRRGKPVRKVTRADCVSVLMNALRNDYA